MLTDEKRKKLREVAEDGAKRSYAPGFFPIFLNPETVLDLLDEIEQLRAQVAVMRELLELALPYVKDAMPDLRGHACGYPDSVCDGECAEAAEIAGLIRKIEQALSADAGRELLERTRKLERFVDAYKNYWQVGSKIFDCGQCTLAAIRGKGYCEIHKNEVTEASEKLEQAYAALEKKED